MMCGLYLSLKESVQSLKFMQDGARRHNAVKSLRWLQDHRRNGIQLSEPQSNRKSVVYTGARSRLSRRRISLRSQNIAELEKLLMRFMRNIRLETLEILVSSISNRVKNVHNSLCVINIIMINDFLTHVNISCIPSLHLIVNNTL